MNRITTGVIVSLLIVAAALAWTTNRYHGNAVKYKGQRDTATHSLKLAEAVIDDMQVRQRDVAALDARYTKELADAKAENDTLRDDVAAGRRR
ncbi:lysis protein, partial [Salmonella enterica subsp. enterica serovar Kisarawe]|nr:lysis protein [Salmonella enterica subsp. enterica serovar Kisarawe]